MSDGNNAKQAVAPRRFKPYPEYKDSGVEWLESIPAHWKVCRADRFLTYDKEQIDPSQLGDDVVFHYSIPSVQETGDGAFENAADIDSAKLVILGPRLLVSKLNPRKGVVVVAFYRHEITVCSSEFIPLKNTGCDLRWAYYLYCSQSPRDRLSGVVQSATRSHQRAKPADIVKMWHGLPPTDEQRAIASFLDRETTKIDELIAKKERLIELLREKRTALITRAATKGLDPNVPMKDSGVEWLGEIPVHWQVEKNGWLFRESDKRSVTGSEELLTVSHITGVTRRSEKPDVTMIEAESHEGYKICRRGEVVINTMWAWMGALGVARELGMVSPSYNVYRPADDRLVGSYYDYVCRIPLHVTEIVRHSKGIWHSRLRLYPDAFREIRTPLPPKAEQNAIAAFLDRETARIDVLVAKVREAIDCLIELRTALISAAVTGKIDVREEVA